MTSKNYVAVYVDESGDLGFSVKASKTFVVAYIIPYNEWYLRKALKRITKRLRRKRKFSGNELKFSRDSRYVISTVFNEIFPIRNPGLNIDIGLVVIDKNAVKPELRKKPTTLYNYLVINYIISNIIAKYVPVHLKFVVDKSMNKSSIKSFNNYLQMKTFWKTYVEREIEPPKTEILHLNSYEEPCLQIADYIAGATFKKFEHNDSRFYDLFKDRIVFRNS
ncbi:MAG: DUF3800 domain-containing protein, partial [Nitrososphaerota archaeon]